MGIYDNHTRKRREQHGLQPTMGTIPYSFGWLNGINFASFVVFGIDKSLAKCGFCRISELVLYPMCVFGPIGALFGMSVFRHKINQDKIQFWKVSMVSLILNTLINSLLIDHNKDVLSIN
eukprot:573986_1